MLVVNTVARVFIKNVQTCTATYDPTHQTVVHHCRRSREQVGDVRWSQIELRYSGTGCISYQDAHEHVPIDRDTVLAKSRARHLKNSDAPLESDGAT